MGINIFKDPETRCRVDQRLYFDMGVFYKVNGVLLSKGNSIRIFFLLNGVLVVRKHFQQKHGNALETAFEN